MQSWAIVATVKERREKLLAFIAHHICLGAAEAHIYLDDPQDPAFEEISPHPAVRATRCDDDHWLSFRSRGRPERLELRQKHNARHAYTRCETDWIIHIDGDEYLDAPHPIGDLLDAFGPEQQVLRTSVHEELYNPAFARDGLSIFKRPIAPSRRGDRLAASVYGDLAPALDRGFMGHRLGKFFVRTGVPGMSLSIHRPALGGSQVTKSKSSGVRLLHAHAGDPDDWVAKVPYRLDYGGYRSADPTGRAPAKGVEQRIADIYREEGEAGLRRFHATVCSYGRHYAPMARRGLIYSTNLWLDAKRRTVFPTGKETSPQAAIDPQTGLLEFDAETHGVRMRIAPGGTEFERAIALGAAPAPVEIRRLSSVLRGHRILFVDLEAGIGLFALRAALISAHGSRIIAYQSDAALRARLKRNAAMNGFSALEVRDLPRKEDADAMAPLFAGLAREIAAAKSEEERPLVAVRLALEGREDAALAALLDDPSRPGIDVIMLSRAEASAWRQDVHAKLETAGFGLVKRFRADALYRKQQETAEAA